MSDYVLNEKDIESTIRYLKIFDPKNADRDYAIQLLEVMQSTAEGIVKDGNGVVHKTLSGKRALNLRNKNQKEMMSLDLIFKALTICSSVSR